MGRENSVVRLDDGVGNTRGGVDAELELRLLAVVVGEALKEKGTEAGTGTTAEGVEDQEPLEGLAVVCKEKVNSVRRCLPV